MQKKNKRGWVLAAGAAIQLCIGIIYIWSIFKDPLTTYFSGYADPALVGRVIGATYSVMLGTFVLGIVLGGRLNDKRGPFYAVLMGGLLFAAGMLLTSLSTAFAPQVPQLVCFFYGGIAGFGVGAAYSSSVSCVQKWYPDKKGFATGVIVCAFGASTVIFTPLVNRLLRTVGAAPTFAVLAIIFLIVLAIFGRFMQNPPIQSVAQKSDMTNNTQKQYKPKEMVKTSQYWLLLLCMMLLTAAYFMFNPLFKAMALQRGLSEGTALLAVMLTGIGSAAGRLLAPWMSDGIGRRQALIVLYIISIVAVILLLITTGPVYVLLISLIAFSFGGSAGIFPAINADYFGTENAGVNYGLIMIGFAASAFLFPGLASMINQGGQATTLTYLLPAVASVAGIMLTLLLRKPLLTKEHGKTTRQ